MVPASPPPSRASRPTRVRHVVLALTVAAYMITYMDRVNISSALPVIQKDLGLSLQTMGWIVGSFRWAYALFQIPGGWLGDRIGPRRALALIVTWWSIFTSATAFAWSATSMAALRFLFGAGEAGAFPIATRSLSRWMLPSERGFAQGITHAGSRLGGALTPVLVVYIMNCFGWRYVFVTFGLLGIVWAATWFWYYRDTPDEHRSVNESERRLIHSSIGNVRTARSVSVPWARILASRTLWTLSLMYFCYAYCISVYLDWFPKYLNSHRGFNLKQMGYYTSLTLLAGTLGDLLGGWASDLWARRSGNLTLARRGTGMFGFLLAAGAILSATFTGSPIASVWFTCLAIFALELTVGVSWAIPLDIGADYAGSVSAVMNTCGNMGGAIAVILLPYLVSGYGWNVPFVVLAGMCVVAALLFLKIDATRKIFAES